MRTLFLALIFFSWLCFAKAQQMNTYADTSKYLINEIGGKKSKYIGKPFSVLLNDLKLTPVDIIQRGWYGLDADKPHFGEGLSIYFNREKKFSKKHFITVKFKNQPSFDILYPLFFPLANMNVNKINEAYKNVVVTDVGVKLYEQDSLSTLYEEDEDD
ncbi:hypothetical protein BWD42_07665 [Sphingobacterium sp. CZ-UAM]|uniref:hypothetical protein n=1 Tax=Sphingobacterium sp. CZ-UAM TaxID=1933868 RepID=UPI000987BC20|nr:hypothetical protein [Sphingobacterium sp. CZ-UAM]OOG19768.1 hypothetical protein BWD42_07665 [Sphingobacterium sp. CZ-UAM]